MSKLLYWGAWATILSAMSLIILAWYWTFYPYNVITFKESKFRVTNNVVRQGESLFYISDYCKNMDIPSRTSRSFIDGIIYTTPSTITNRESGCHSVKVQIHIPDEIPVGKYHLQILYQYQVNPIRMITVQRRTTDFTILESTQSAQLRLRDY